MKLSFSLFILATDILLATFGVQGGSGSITVMPVSTSLIPTLMATINPSISGSGGSVSASVSDTITASPGLLSTTTALMTPTAVQNQTLIPTLSVEETALPLSSFMTTSSSSPSSYITTSSVPLSSNMMTSSSSLSSIMTTSSSSRMTSSLVDVTSLLVDATSSMYISSTQFMAPTPTPSLPLVFPAPYNVTLLEKGMTTFSIEWKAPPAPSGYSLSGYNVTYNHPVTGSVTRSLGNVTFFNESGLNRGTQYTVTVTVQAIYQNNNNSMEQTSQTSANVTFMTDSNKPPENVKISHITQISLAVNWTKPDLPESHSSITHYQVTYNANETLVDSNVTNLEISSLAPFTFYSISVATGTKHGFGLPSSPVNATTRIGAPSPPQFNASSEGPRTINVTWTKPDFVNGPEDRLQYLIDYMVVNKTGSSNMTLLEPSRTTLLRDLLPNTMYEIGVQAFNNDEDNQTQTSESSERRVVQTDVDAPVRPSQPIVRNRTANGIVIDLPMANDANGPISKYEVWVLKGNASLPEAANASNEYQYSDADDKTPNTVYVAALYENHVPNTFILGDNSTVTYRNGPLVPGIVYRIVVRVFTTAEGQTPLFTDSAPSGKAVIPMPPTPTLTPTPTLPAVTPSALPSSLLPTREGGTGGTGGISGGAAAAIAIVLIIAVAAAVVVMLVLMKKRQIGPFWKKGVRASSSKRKSSTSRNGSLRRVPPLFGVTTANPHADGAILLDGGLPPTPPETSPAMRGVSLDEFPDYVASMHMHSDIGFSEEYDRIRSEEKRYATVASSLPANEAKNRYGNVNAYDHSRVRLNPIEGEDGSDYINANFIDGYNGEREYIAAQGPVPVTVADFWRMIWEVNCRSIVMVTNLKERGRVKCDQYWPDEGRVSYDDISIETQDTADLSSYVVRTFKIIRFPDEEESVDESKSGDVRIIKQYHFVVWPDHGVPEQAAPLLSFVRKIRAAVKAEDGPMVIHCSAGVGRTGTFIALDHLLQSMGKEGKIDVYGLVSRMRRQRNLMVQTEAQYVFIHDALLEAVNFGITEIPITKLKEAFNELKKMNHASGFTGMTEEFETLDKDPPPPLPYCAGAREVNEDKNRSSEIIPTEKSRVILRRTPGVDGTDYINASFINDYGRPKAFIATQAPLGMTMDDFWRMIWEHGSSTIVMLSTLDEEGLLRYWPAKKGASFSEFRVDLLSSQEYGTYSRRDFSLSSTGYDYTRTVRHFQLQVWPADATPDLDVCLALLDLISQVSSWQQTAPEGPVVVHCDYGIGRTGVYCALNSILKRIKAEGVVDVLQTVRSLRGQRPYMIQNGGQYEFLYKTVVEFLEAFDPYSNFK